MAQEMLIGVDVGTTSVKAILFDLAGAVIDHYAEPYETVHGKHGVVEQDPELWMKHIFAALSQFAANHDLSEVMALGLTSQVNTHLFVDENGEALAPAIVWQDGRCANVAARLDHQVAVEDRVRWWGAPRPIDASHCMSRMAWMSENRPDIWEKTRWVMLPKDYCIQRLTGEAVSDQIGNLGLVDAALSPIPDLFAHVPGAAERVVPLAPMTAIAGKVRDGLPCAGVPVAVGTMDAWAGMFGIGVPGAGHAMYLSGTSEVLGILSDAVKPSPGVIVFPSYDGLTLHAGPTQSGGESLHWCARLLGHSPEMLASKVEALDFDAPAPLFLPHLQGERAPLWDIHARGTFLGVDGGAGPAEIARSVMEGVACSARWVQERLEVSADVTPDTINCGGGGFKSDIWNQIRATVLDKRLKRASVGDPGVLGAAGIAAVATGLMPDLSTAFASLVQFDHVYEPDPARRGHYDRLFDLYKQAYESTKDLSHALVGLHER
ncbi:MAG: carbohydrate kinase [Rhizobiaceae bacterium MnEN-MB40S]|nr:MAG: carbohydrate kinase [Rhizobiaceae bacterium MnEN-MB40S]